MIPFSDVAGFLFPFSLPPEQRWTLVIAGSYFDESVAQGCFSLAGYMANYYAWVHFDWKWRALLEKWKIAYFKASECDSGFEQFAQYRDNPNDVQARLKQHEKDKLRAAKIDFVDCILDFRHEISGYGTVVIENDFARLMAEDSNARRLLMGNPYYIALQLALVGVALPIYEYNQPRPKDKRCFIKPIFDSHKEYSKYTKLLFDKFAAKNPKSREVLLPPDHESDMDTAALQAADLLAYEARKLLVGQLASPPQPERVAMIRLLPTVQKIFKLDYDTLRMLMARQKPDSISIQPAIEGGKLNMKKSNELERFENLTDGLLSVPHAEIKEKLEREKQAKKRKKSKTSSASRAASDR